MNKQAHPSLHRKAEQLRVAIQRALSTALDCDVDDPLLDDLYVDDVVVEPGGSFAALFVTERVQELDSIQERLREAAPVFRTALADSLTRKRVPNVTLFVIPPRERERPVDLRDPLDG